MAEGSAGRAFGQQRAEEVGQVLFGSADVLAAVQHRGEVGVVALVGDLGVGGEDGFEAPGRAAAGMVAHLGQVVQVFCDVAFVPGQEDGFDVWEVFVERGAADAGLLGDLGHGHGGEAVRGDQRGRGVHGRFAHGVAVRVDRFVPQLRHHPRIHYAILGDSLS